MTMPFVPPLTPQPFSVPPSQAPNQPQPLRPSDQPQPPPSQPPSQPPSSSPPQQPMYAPDDQEQLDYIAQHRGEPDAQILEGLRQLQLQQRSRHAADTSGFQTVDDLTPEWWAQNHPDLRSAIESALSLAPYAGGLGGGWIGGLLGGGVGSMVTMPAGAAIGGAAGGYGESALEQKLGMEPYDPTRRVVNAEVGGLLGGLGGGGFALARLAGLGRLGRLGTAATSPIGRIILRKLGEHIPYIGPFVGPALDLGEMYGKSRGVQTAQVLSHLGSKLDTAGTGREPPISPAEGGTVSTVPQSTMNSNQFTYGQDLSGQGVTPGAIPPSAFSLLWSRLLGLGTPPA